MRFRPRLTCACEIKRVCVRECVGVWVCERERERERERVCVGVCVCVRVCVVCVCVVCGGVFGWVCVWWLYGCVCGVRDKDRVCACVSV